MEARQPLRAAHERRGAAASDVQLASGHRARQALDRGLIAAEISVDKKQMRANIVGYQLKNGRWLHVIGEGRLVNLAAGNGHPVEIMDMSFGIQALCARYLADHRGQLKAGLYPVPANIDREVALRKLEALEVRIDRLSAEQEAYLRSWNA